MTLIEITVLILFTLWLLCALWVGLTKRRRFYRLKKFLWYNGWFSRWTMFLPDKDGNVKSFTISYRDEQKDGGIGPWQIVELDKPWSPALFFVNPHLRLYGFMLNALQSFAHFHDVGKKANESALFPYFTSIILGYSRTAQAQNRQIQVKRYIEEREEILIESDFLNLS